MKGCDYGELMVREKSKYLQENLCHSHFVHHNYYMYWPWNVPEHPR